MATENIFQNISTIDENADMMSFTLTPTNVAYANTLRRTVLTGVESVAFRSDMNEKGQTSDVTVRENSTPMTNEMLADRIGLIPVHADPDSWNPEDYIFELKVENTTEDSLPVRAGDFEVRKRGQGVNEDTNVLVGNKEFFHPDRVSKDTSLIAVLKGKQPSQAGQKIHLVAKATIGMGRDHIRFSPVSQCSYGYTIDSDEVKQKMQFEKWLRDSKNKKLEDLKEARAANGESLEEVFKREFQTMEVQRCYKVNPDTNEPNSFDFVVESVGVQPVEKIIEKALLNIERKCLKYAAMDKEAPDTVRIQNADARMKGFDFIFQHEDHTLGNLLQTYMDEHMMGTEITFVGYKVPHPLRDEMVIRVGVDFPLNPDLDGKETVARTAIAKAANECAVMFRKWREDWLRAIANGQGRRNLQSLRLTAENARAAEQSASLARQAVAQTQPQSRKRVGTKA